MGATTATWIRSGTSVIRRSCIPPRASVRPTTNWSQPDTVGKSKAETCLLVVVEPNHSWWWPFRSPTNRNEACVISNNIGLLYVAFFDILSITQYYFSYVRGRLDDFSFFDCWRPFYFWLNEFHCIFSISYKMLTNYVYYYCILI